jgi:hypothetical protein
MYARGYKAIKILVLFRNLWSLSKIQGAMWVVTMIYGVGLRGMII